MAAMDPPAKTTTTPAEQVDHSKMDHSKMDHGTTQPATMDHSSMDHSSMDHSSMDHSSMDHAAMGHGSPAPTEPRRRSRSRPTPTAPSAFPPIAHGAMEHAPEINSLLLIDRLEHWDGKSSNGQAWEATGWIGGNINRLWLRTDGETQPWPHRVIIAGSALATAAACRRGGMCWWACARTSGRLTRAPGPRSASRAWPLTSSKARPRCTWVPAARYWPGPKSSTTCC